MTLPTKYYQMTSTVTNDAQLRMELVQNDFPKPKPHEVVIRVEASPINPSDQGVMFGWSNMANAYHKGEGLERVLTRAYFRSRHGNYESKNWSEFTSRQRRRWNCCLNWG